MSCLVVAALCSCSTLTARAQEQGLPEEEAAFFRMYGADEEVIEAPTRHPKPLSEVAENVTIVTAQQIRDLNAHTVAEVLARVTGVFVDSFGNNFGSLSVIQAQGSRAEQVTVLVDGIPWNLLSGGNAPTVTIPVGIVDRIEVIKGPASSAWGSSLGGVVNVITKAPGRTRLPEGTVSVSGGERHALDGRAEFAGAAGPAGYYLYGGYQRAEWERNEGDFSNRDTFGKLTLPLSPHIRLGLSAGYDEPEAETGRLASQGVVVRDDLKAVFGGLTLDADLGARLGMNVSVYGLNQRVTGKGEEDGTFGPEGDLVRETTYDEETYGLRSRLVWRPEGHTVVLGFDLDRGQLDQTVDSGEFFQSLGAPARLTTHPDLTRWGLYANDTLTWGGWTLTPGLRLDDSSESDPFLSPSLGVTRKLGARTLLRALAARGFSLPPLSEVSGGGINVDPNPELEPEKVWSFQVGVETKAVPYLWLKGTLFHHDVRDYRVVVPSERTPGNVTFENGGRAPRTGFEAELETAPLLHTSLRGGFAYVRVNQPEDLRDADQYAADLGLYFNIEDSFHAQLDGHFVWWDLGPGSEEGDHDDFLWDLNAWKRFRTGERTAADLFLTVHNLFDGEQFADPDRGNPKRWVEGGVRFQF